MEKFLIVFALFFYTIIGLYFGAGSITRIDIEEKLQDIENNKDKLLKDTVSISYSGSSFKNMYDFETALAMEDLEPFPLLNKVNNLLATLIAACSFGLIGAVISLILEVAYNNQSLIDLKVWSKPFLGALTGIVIVAMIYLLPAFLVKSEGNARPYSLMFLALFSGIYTKNFYNFLTATILSKIFKDDKK